MGVDRDGAGRRTPSPDERWAGLVAEVATMPDVVANLLGEHRSDGNGYCVGTGCGAVAHGGPAARWPCSLHALAAAAQRLRRGD